MQKQIVAFARLTLIGSLATCQRLTHSSLQFVALIYTGNKLGTTHGELLAVVCVHVLPWETGN